MSGDFWMSHSVIEPAEERNSIPVDWEQPPRFFANSDSESDCAHVLSPIHCWAKHIVGAPNGRLLVHPSV